MKELLRGGFAALGLPLSDAALERFCAYFALLTERNKVMNLTAISGTEDVARLHFLDCAALLTLHDFTGKSVIDVGTGAGFPGLPLRMAEETIDLTLLDSLDKRVRFLEEVCAATELTDVACIHARAEERRDLRERYDVAVSRAVARLELLSEMCLPYVKVGGAFLAMKGPDCAAEIEAARRAIETLGGGAPEVLRYTIPGADVEHCVVRIEKISPTPERYPRRWAQMQKGFR